jgi:hypothetical protein
MSLRLLKYHSYSPKIITILWYLQSVVTPVFSDASIYVSFLVSAHLQEWRRRKLGWAFAP